MKHVTLYTFFSAVIFINTVTFSQDITNSDSVDIDEYFADWTYDSLLDEGFKYTIISAGRLDQGLKQAETIELIEYSIIVLNEAISRNDKNPNAYFWRGMAKSLKKEYALALIDFSTASKLEPKNFKNFEQKAYCKKNLQDYYGAIQDYTIAVNLTTSREYSQYDNIYADRGGCYLLLGKNKEALEDLNNAIAINPDVAKYYLLRAFSKLELSSKEDACLDFSKAGELGSSQAYEEIQKYCNN